jgi:hypothetical protein
MDKQEDKSIAGKAGLVLCFSILEYKLSWFNDKNSVKRHFLSLSMLDLNVY